MSATSSRRMAWRLGAIALMVAAAVVVVTEPWASSPPKSTAPAPKCQSSPQAAIDALPVGGTFHAHGCYLVPLGLVLTKPVTITGPAIGPPVQFDDPSAKLSGTHSGGLAPVVKVIDTQAVTLENLLVVGGNPSGGYNGKLVNQAGIEILSSSDVDVSDVQTDNTFGDGVELVGNYELGHPKPVVPDTVISVNTLKVTHAGRDCFNPIEVTDSTFASIDCVSSDKPSVNMESDEPPLGSGDLTFNDLTAPKGVYVQEPITGTLSFNLATLGMRFYITDGTASVTGSIVCQRAAWPACIHVGATATLSYTGPITYEAGVAKVTEAPYNVDPGGQIVVTP